VPHYTTSAEIVAVSLAGDSIPVTGPGTLQVGDNTFTFTVAAEDTAINQDYRITVRRLSNDATLSNVRIDGTPISGFNPEIVEYTATIKSAVDTVVTFTPTTNHPKATATVTGPNSLNNTTITVTAEDTLFNQVYMIRIIRLNDVTLGGLSINGTDMSSGGAAYRDSIAFPYNTTEALIKATANHPKATVETAEGSIKLNIGNNYTFVTVISEDKFFMAIYRLILRRLSNDNTLRSLAINDTPVPDFNHLTTAYRIAIPYTPTGITVSAEPNHPGATVTTIIPNQITVGDNPVAVVVVAEDTNIYFRQAYNITVTLLNSDTILPGDPSAASVQTYPDPATLHAAGISTTAAATVQVRSDSRLLHVTSPVAEQIYAYAVTGNLLGSWDKQPGKATFISPPGNRILIIKGSSGWVKKILVCD
jgi:hypothetical protein